MRSVVVAVVLLAGLAVAPALTGCPPAATTCNSDAQCAETEQCVGGRCAAIAGVVCPAGEHDGGDGACVAADACGAGFGFLFVDGDGDGHGGTTPSADCFDEGAPAPDGFSADDGDCDDQNAGAFALDSWPFDADNDGFSARADVCGDGTRPFGALLDDAFAPVLATNPRTAVSGGVFVSDWTDVDNVLFADGAPAVGDDGAVITVGGFDCAFEPLAATALAVRVRVAVDNTNVTAITAHATVSVAGGVPSVERVASVSTGQRDFFDLVIGGEDLFGLTALTPAAACRDVTVALFFDVESSFFSESVELDTVSLQIVGAHDCDDGDAAFFSPALLFGDADGDGAGGGDGQSACLNGLIVPAGFTARSTDCNELDANVREGQTAFFAAPSVGVGGAPAGFDYDCNESEEPSPVVSATSCTADNGNCTSSTVELTGACGGDLVRFTCPASPPCTLSSALVPQACR